MTETPVFLLALLVAAIAMLPVAMIYLHRRGRPKRRLSLLMLGLVVVGVTAFSWGQYSWRQGGRMIDPLAEHAKNPEQSVGDLAKSFEHRLASEPAQASIENLVLLARSFEASRNHARAAQSYAQANAKGNFRNPDMLVAEAQARLRSSSLSEQDMAVARERAEQALAIAPAHPGAHYLAGDLALRDGALTAAIEHFERVVAADVLAPGAQAALENRLQEWRAEAAGGSVPGEAPVAIRVRVEAGASLVAEAASLFVYAREPGGSSMPLAARRIESARLPLTVELGDRDRLRDGPSLSTYEALEVGARLSSSGTAGGALGDPSAVARIQPGRDASATLRLQD